MVKPYAHLPEDIAAEKRTAAELRREYKGAFLSGLRNFRALRQQAPGIIAEFIIGALITIVVLLTLFHDLNVTGLIPTVGICLAIVVVIGVCSYTAGRIWRIFGLTIRDRVRYVVKNIWVLIGSGLVTASVIINVFFSGSKSPVEPTTPQAVASTPVAIQEREPMPKPSEQASLELPPSERSFAGQGWQIVHNSDNRYVTARVEDAPARCADLGDDWMLALGPDFEDLELELKEGGHIGKFWSDTKTKNSILGFSINTDGSSQLQWEPSRNKSARIVLCVMAISI